MSKDKDLDYTKKIVNNKKNNKSKSKKSNLETTTRIRIDKERINDLDTLDTSFLEGRMSKKTKNNRKAKERILTEKRQIINHLELLKNIMFIIAFITIIVIIIIYLINNTDLFSKKSDGKEENKIEEIDTIVDHNYLFIGDYYSENINFNDFNVDYVSKVNKDYETKDILDNMKDLIYKYNPSVVIIELGMNDLEKNIPIEDISSNIEKIVEGIENNRPYAKIYIESIYPINKEMASDKLNNVTQEKILELNKEIRKIVDNYKINYLDIYSYLSFNNELRNKFSDDGVHLNNMGNNEIEKKLREVVDENEKEKIKKDKD